MEFFREKKQQEKKLLIFPLIFVTHKIILVIKTHINSFQILKEQHKFNVKSDLLTITSSKRI
jgi:hypothetical protein